MRLLVSIVSLTLFGLNATSHAEDIQRTEVRPDMFSLSTSVLALQPMIAEPDLFNSPSNYDEILQHTKRMVEVSSGLQQHNSLNSPAFQVPVTAIQKNLEASLDALKQNRLVEARALLSASLNACSSCHAKDSKRKLPAWRFNRKQVHGSPIERARFWRVVRDYDSASIIYAQQIRNYPKYGIGMRDVREAIQGQMLIDLKVRKNPKKAERNLNIALENKAIPSPIIREVNFWIQAVSEIQKEVSLKDLQSKDFKKKMQSQMKKIQSSSPESYEGSVLAKLIYLSGLISQYADESPEKIDADFLYWMGEIESWIQKPLGVSLSNVYFRQCAEKFGNTSTGKKCKKRLTEG